MALPATRTAQSFSAFKPAATIITMGLAIVIGLTAIATQGHGQTINVIHRFSFHDGSQPETGVTMDRAGNLYGTTYSGGRIGDGVVYKLTRVGSQFVSGDIYNFAGGSDGAHPWAGALVFGPDGALYGTTYGGGNGGCGSLGFGCGTVFRLTPPATVCVAVLCSWNETVLYRFSGGADGASPRAGIVFDQAGNLYGTTLFGGSTSGPCVVTGCGVVFELSPSAGGWTQTVIHAFTSGTDGSVPYSGLTFDNAGNLYGTTTTGGLYSEGIVYELTPAGPGWTENILYNFTGGADGRNPTADLLLDDSGRIYGLAFGGEADPNRLSLASLRTTPWQTLPPVNGTAFRLTPNGGSWTFELLYSFTLANNGSEEPNFKLVMDSSMNLYGVATGGGLPPAYDGAVFKLTPGDPQWTYTAIYNFTEDGNGADPECALVFDASGNLYGTALGGAGIVFEITP